MDSYIINYDNKVLLRYQDLKRETANFQDGSDQNSL